MTALAAALDVERRSIDSDVTAMVAAGLHRGGDGAASWVGEGVGLGIALFRTLPTEPSRAAVHATPDGRFHAVLDGRIDNLDDLDRAAAASGASDVAIVVEHLRRRGAGGLADLVGDFAVVVWDGRDRQLLAACDPLAGRALFTCTLGGRLVVASEICQLLAVPWVPDDLDVGMLAEVLAGVTTSVTTTVRRAVSRIAPGEVLVARPGEAPRRRTFWRLEPNDDRRPDTVLVEELAATLDVAVTSRLRGCGRIAAELSGGLDSSTVVALAARHAPDLLALTNSYVEPAADERALAALVAERADVELVSVDDDGGVWDAADDVARGAELPGPPDARDSLRLAALARRRGCRVLLTGQGGDQVLAGLPAAALDQLRHGQLRRAAEVAWANGRGRGLLRLGRGGWWIAVDPLCRWAQPARGARRDAHVALPWLTDQFVRHAALRERMAADAGEPRRRPWDGPRLEAIAGAGVVVQWDVLNRVYGRVPIDSRHPFMDRRLVELAASVPARFTVRGDDWRILQRRVVDGIVPPTIRDRRDKAEFSHLAARWLAAVGGRELFAACAPVRLGWVDGDEVVRMYDAFVADERRPHGAALVAIASVHALVEPARGGEFAASISPK